MHWVFVRVSRHRRALVVAATLLCVMLIPMHTLYHDALNRYESLLSVAVYDRHGEPILTSENTKGHYAYELTSLPPQFEKLLIQKEDRFFYYHMGINPVSTARAAVRYIQTGHAGGASTISQQLAKNLLGTESERTLSNKLRESMYAIALELFTRKDEILCMYANTVFLGNQVQGFESGSRAYFNTPLRDTTVHEQVALLATLSHPSSRNPWKEESVVYARALYERLNLKDTYVPPHVTSGYTFQAPSAFEFSSAGLTCAHTCTTTIDDTLSEVLRSLLRTRIDAEYDRGARNGAIVVIDAHTEDLLAMVGSPDPSRDKDGSRINMALEPRPIGSTVKPFIYLKGFMDGLRPYTLVDDREYKYPIATGFSLYPKNFDGVYHGVITLHSALSNSYNVPTVKVLEYIGLTNFYTFLEETLHFNSIVPLQSYEYGIALGGLEMDLLTLSHYFTIFPRGGTIAPLNTGADAVNDSHRLPPQSRVTSSLRIAPPEYVALVHAILSDRITGVDQFGLTSNLNLTIPAYGVKTGTSRDFHDSWVVGYTPDYVVGVWIGNSENEPLKQVSGQSGAGAIWHDVMEYLATTPYYRNHTFLDSPIRGIDIDGSLEWGLPQDSIQEHQNVLITDTLIMNPHNEDTFELNPKTTIPLRARTLVRWSIDSTDIGEGTDMTWTPTSNGTYMVHADSLERDQDEEVTIHITSPSP